VEGRYHPRWLPLLSEKGRFGLGYGKFTDRANQLEFNGVVMNFEADLIYALSGTSRWSVVAALNWKSGNLLRVEAAALDSSDRHLPINWVGTSVGMHYSF